MLREAEAPPATRARLRMADTVSLVTIDGRAALFSEPHQKLFALNEGAVHWLERLQAGLEHDVIEAIFSARDPGTIAVRDLLLHWSLEGVAALDVAVEDSAHTCQTIDLAGVAIRLRYGSADMAHRIAPMFRHLEHDGAGDEASLCYDVLDRGAYALVIGPNNPAKLALHAQAGPLLKGLIAEDVLTAPGAIAALHAACLTQGNEALLLLGAPGTGKSVMTMALLTAGFGYAGDDIALMHAAGMVRGLPFLPSAKAGAWRLIGRTQRDWTQSETHLRPDGRRVRYLMPRAALRPEWLKVGWIVSLHRTRTGEPWLDTQSREGALAALIREGRAPGGRMSAATLDAMIAMISDAHCCTLTYSEAADAAHRLSALCRHG